jgi:hypothetical protein
MPFPLPPTVRFPSPLRQSTVAVLAIAAAAALLPAPAAAGSYTVRQCDYAAGIGDHDFVWQSAGTPPLIPHSGSGCGEFGLAARASSPGQAQTYPSGGYGGWFAYAPPGTMLTSFSGAFGVLAGCCINGLATYAEATEQSNGAGARAYLFQGNLGNDSWYAPSGLQGPVGRSWHASTSGFAARRVGFHVRCGPGFSCFQQPSGDLRVRGRSFDFTLRDDVAPIVAAPGGSLLGGGWSRGVASLSFAAADTGGGLTGVAASFDDGTLLASPSSCAIAAGRYVRLQPCPLERAGAWSVDTAKLPDGARAVTVEATDAGGAAARAVATARVDNTAPATPAGASVVGGSGWRAANGFTLGWTNPAGQHAPIARARYRACLVGGDRCVDGERVGAGVDRTDPIALPQAGEWDARVWLEDAAGNADPASATAALRLRLDPDPPLLSFLPVDPAAPAAVAVEASDRSGIAAAAIELRRRGAADWRALPVVRDGSRLRAEIDDSRIARGVYELRARATDAAGNESFAHAPDRALPIRAETRLRAAVVRLDARGHLGCRRLASALCWPLGAPRRTTVRAPHLSTIAIEARLTTVAGRPLGERRVTVALVSRDRTVRLPDARTDAAGGIALLLAARRSAVVELGFAGDGDTLPSAGRTAVHVPAPVTIRASRRRVRGGRAMTFSGRLRGGAIPRRGKLVEVQAHFRGRWRTVSAVRTTRAGRWRFRYAFGPAARRTSYRFRARVPIEAGYPFAAGASRPVRVTVLPR